MGQTTSGLRRLLSHPCLYDGFQDLVGAARLRARLIAEHLAPFPGARLLDIGCGTARFVECLPEDVDYTGFDMSPGYIAAARRRHGRRGTFTCAKVGEVALAAGSFDLALAFGVLHHLDDVEARRLFESARAALVPGGRLVTIDPTFVDGQSRLARLAVSRDRGRDVRRPEGYARLADGVFAGVEVSVLHDALRIPYTHAVLDCVA